MLGGVVDDGDEGGADGLAGPPGEEGRAAVESAAGGAAGNVAGEAGGHHRFEDDGNALRLGLARAQLVDRALGGDAAKGLGVQEAAKVAFGAEPPGVALLAVLVVGEGLGGERDGGGGVAGGEPARVGEGDLARAGGEACALGVGDARIETEGGGFAGASHVDAVVEWQALDALVVELEGIRPARGEQLGVGEAGVLVGGGDAGELDGFGDELLEGGGREVGGRADGGAAAGDDAQTEGVGAGLNQLLDFPQADGNRGLGVGGGEGVALLGAASGGKLDGAGREFEWGRLSQAGCLPRSWRRRGRWGGRRRRVRTGPPCRTSSGHRRGRSRWRPCSRGRGPRGRFR